MTKLLRGLCAIHRPAYASKMTPENGYDETKHTKPSHLVDAGIITPPEGADLNDCIETLFGGQSAIGAAQRSVETGTLPIDKANDFDFVRELAALDGTKLNDNFTTNGDDDEDEDDDEDDDDDARDPEDVRTA